MLPGTPFTFATLLWVLLDPSAATLGLVLGWLVSGWRGVVLSGVVVFAIFVLGLVKASVAISLAPNGSERAVLSFLTAEIFNIVFLRVGIGQAISAMLWACLGQFLRKRWQKYRVSSSANMEQESQ